MSNINALEIITKLWPIFFATVGFVVWIIRLEMKVHYQDKVIHEVKEDLKEIKAEIKAINSNLSNRRVGK
jgi:hypothetical protein